MIKCNKFLLCVLIFFSVAILQNANANSESNVYDDALSKFAMMQSIYNSQADITKTNNLKIKIIDIEDETGLMSSIDADMQQEITKMMTNSLNAIGNKTIMLTDDNKTANVLISSSISEFSSEAAIKDNVSTGSEQNKTPTLTITLNFTLTENNSAVDTKKIQVTHKAKLSNTFDELRQAIQLSMIELLGHYQKLPYWNLSKEITPDNNVIEQIKTDYQALSDADKIAKIQELLYLSGYLKNVSGQLDNETIEALSQFNKMRALVDNRLMNETTFLALYNSIAISSDSQNRRNSLNLFANTPSNTATLPFENTLIKIATNKSNYRIGEQIVIQFSVNKPLYLKMIIVNSKGVINKLVPSDYQMSDYFQAGINYTLPANDANFSFIADKPIGIDKIHVIASEKVITDDIAVTASGELNSHQLVNYPIHATVQYTIKQ